MGNQDKHHVVIVGGGFGGLWAARSLKNSDTIVTLIDKNNFHLFQPLLYQVATGSLSPADIASPLRGILVNQKNITVKLDEMIGIDLIQQQVLLDNGMIHYDSLIVATGSENHYFGNEQWQTIAPGLKSINDALQIRNRIYSAFEMAEKETNPLERKRIMTFVIVGGGPTGVELAGSLAEIARITLRDNFRSINPADSKIYVIDSSPNILNGYNSKLSYQARKTLNKLGVSVLSNAFVENINNNGITVLENENSYLIESRTVFWAAGVKPSSVGNMLTKDKDGLDSMGRVIVKPDLSLPSNQNIYVIGDLAHKRDLTGTLLPGTAPVAMSQGRYVANLIICKLKGKPVKPYRYRNFGKMAVIGRGQAVADFGWLYFTGYPAWLLWLFVHLMYLVEYDNRLIVFIQWAWSYFTKNRGARLITYDYNHNDKPNK